MTPNLESGLGDLGAALTWVFLVIATISATVVSYVISESKSRCLIILFSIIFVLSIVLALFGVFLHGLYDLVPGVN